MYRLSLTIIFLLLGIMPILGQSPHGEQLKMDCVRCHNPSGWNINYQTIQFNHDKTDFQLEGTHQQTDCKLCHSSMVFDQAPMECVSCHTDVHSQSVGNDCMQCHDSETWLVDNIPELHEANGFPLIGSHSNLSCVECHTSETSLRFDRIGNDCISCHQDDYASTQTPNHTTAGYSTDCIECHNPLGFGWDSESINHDFFPLTQGHDIQDCTQCHTTGNYSDASPECVSCHQDDYMATQDPNHQTSGFSTDCASCHTTNPGWSPADIGNHDFFPLTLGHDIEDCTQCHTTGNYSDASPECVSCHQDDYMATQDPNHQTSGFSTDCVVCHTTNPGWAPADINHDFFPLTLGHDIQDCTQCHTNGTYSGLSPECVSCHQSDYDQTNDPNHSTSGFSTDCVVCHTTNPGWTPADINHDFFPLTLGHDIQDCTQCHTNGTYSGLSPECVSCHQSDYDQTADPNHSTSGFSTDCVSCHTTNPGWTPADINHDFFPLTLGHDIQDCTQCHTNGTYSGLSPECVSCHQSDYDQTADPNHSTSGFSTDCVTCHTTNPGWTPATINHDFFPLTLGHDIQDCTQCHTNGTYTGLSPDCVNCHQDDYDQTNDPNHMAAGFPTDCVACHTTNPGWTPAEFDHDGQYFPIYSGKHREGEAWNDCVECHANPASYADFTCFTCHGQSETNNDHNEVNDYEYVSTACLQCHPDGNN